MDKMRILRNRAVDGTTLTSGVCLFRTSSGEAGGRSIPVLFSKVCVDCFLAFVTAGAEFMHLKVQKMSK